MPDGDRAAGEAAVAAAGDGEDAIARAHDLTAVRPEIGAAQHLGGRPVEDDQLLLVDDVDVVAVGLDDVRLVDALLLGVGV